MLWRRLVAVAVMVALIVPIATGGRAQQGDNAATPAPTAVGSPAGVPTRVPVTALPSTGAGGDQPGIGWLVAGLSGLGLVLIALVVASWALMAWRFRDRSRR